MRARFVAALALGVLAFAGTAAPAQATYPGRNGSLVFTSHYSHGPETDAISLQRLNPRSGGGRTEPLCDAFSDPPKRCNAASAAAVSPDGRHVATVFYKGFVPPFDAGLRVDDRAADVADPFPFSWYVDGGAGIRWLPTGDRLSVELNDGTTRELRLDGSVGGELLPWLASQVDWAIDGRAAFIRNADLHVLEPGGRDRRLTFRGAANPTWSPHGRWIAFTRPQGLVVVPAGGGKARRVLTGDVRAPVWSPDGRVIAFVRRGYNRIADWGETTFYLYNRRTKRVRRLAGQLGGEDTILSRAEWQPLPR